MLSITFDSNGNAREAPQSNERCQASCKTNAATTQTHQIHHERETDWRSLAEVVDLESPLPVLRLVLDKARALGGSCGLELLGEFGDSCGVLGGAPGGLVHLVDAQQADLCRLVQPLADQGLGGLVGPLRVFMVDLQGA